MMLRLVVSCTVYSPALRRAAHLNVSRRRFSSGKFLASYSDSMWEEDWMKKDYPPLITPRYLRKKLEAKTENLRILDASWHMPLTNRSALSEFRQDHIPEAQFFDIDECCDKSDPTLDHSLPTPEAFAEYVSRLGIDNESHVVLYDNNSTFGMFSAPRVWFMFRLFGHDRTSVLDGGFPKWLEETDRLATDEIPK